VKGGGYRGTRLRRVGIRIFASVVSLMVGQRVSDTTSGFRAVNRKALRLFAAQYPHDYPEVESMVLLLHVDDLGIELGNLVHSELAGRVRRSS
jgi:hypothetical protein